MEKEIKETKTIKAIGMGPYISECKQAEKEGYKLLGNPEVKGQEYTQVCILYN